MKQRKYKFLNKKRLNKWGQFVVPMSTLRADALKIGDIVIAKRDLSGSGSGAFVTIPKGTTGRVADSRQGFGKIIWAKSEWGVSGYKPRENLNLNPDLKYNNLAMSGFVPGTLYEVQILKKQGRDLRKNEYLDAKYNIRKKPKLQAFAGQRCPKCGSPVVKKGYSQGYGSQSSFHEDLKCSNKMCGWSTHNVYD